MVQQFFIKMLGDKKNQGGGIYHGCHASLLYGLRLRLDGLHGLLYIYMYVCEISKFVHNTKSIKGYQPPLFQNHPPLLGSPPFLKIPHPRLTSKFFIPSFSY